LIDEVLSPDSSRFWPKYKYSKGKSQESFDKQFIRDYLSQSGWNKKPPAPEVPEDIINKTSEKYKEAYELLVE
jgi:phosphoribosylaminoimidazole-succinocarboxamide synthase